MKKILLSLILLPLLACSCKSLRYSENTYTIKYNKYIDEGFYIYPKEASNISLNYIPISQICIEIQEGKPIEGQDLKGLVLIKEGDPNTFADKAVPTYEYMLDLLVTKAKKEGANAIINLNWDINEKGKHIIEGLAVKLEK
ncbi:MAG: hypothetical protein LUF01_02825 [Bacteroides sp.]|nr:hypothetical protein [Bacteroides sp.]